MVEGQLSGWPQEAETPEGKLQGNRVLQFSLRNNFLNSCQCSKLGRWLIVSAPSLEVCDQGMDGHFVESQRVYEDGPLALLATLS